MTAACQPSGSENWSDLLYQGEVWVSTDGPIRVEDMTAAHASRAYHWVLRQAQHVLLREQMSMTFGPQPSGDMACDAFNSALEELYDHTDNPEAWLSGTPLLRALGVRGGLVQPDPDEENELEGVPDPEPVFYDRRPHRVAAVRFDGTNLDALSALVGPFVVVTEKLVSGPGPCRGMQQAAHLKTMQREATVPVNCWLLTEEDQFWCLSDTQFRKEYVQQIVDAVILCYCGEDFGQGSHLMCYPGMD